MLECHILPRHIFLAINIQNSEVEHLHKFEQALLWIRRCNHAQLLRILVDTQNARHSCFQIDWTHLSQGVCGAGGRRPLLPRTPPPMTSIFSGSKVYTYASDLDLSFLEHYHFRKFKTMCTFRTLFNTTQSFVKYHKTLTFMMTNRPKRWWTLDTIMNRKWVDYKTFILLSLMNE